MPDDADLERAHAEQHYGKYSAGYNRGYARGREERWALAIKNDKLLKFLRRLEELNQACDGNLLPSEIAAELDELLA